MVKYKFSHVINGEVKNFGLGPNDGIDKLVKIIYIYILKRVYHVNMYKLSSFLCTCTQKKPKKISKVIIMILYDKSKGNMEFLFT